MKKKCFGAVRHIKTTEHQISTKAGSIFFTQKKSYRRRTISICIDKKARVTVSAPSYSPQKDIDNFIHEKAEWIQEKIDQAQEYVDYISSKKYEHGHRFFFLGQDYPLYVESRDIKRLKIDFDGCRWMISLPNHLDGRDRREKIKDALFKWYRDQAKELVGGRVFHYSRIIGLGPQAISIRTQKRIWGNCDTRTGKINLNWSIILTPVNVIDYIVVHELCHLKVPNHSQRFWREVKRFFPNYKESIRWLKLHARELALPEHE